MLINSIISRIGGHILVKIGQRIKIRDTLGRRNLITLGRICIITKHYIVVQTKLWKEAFTFQDIRIGRYEFLRIKRGEC